MCSKNITDEVISFSIGQVVSEKENMSIPSSTSLDQRFSDVVAESRYSINNNMNLSYNFSIDQGYKNFNYNEIGADFTFEKAKFNLSFLEEKKHGWKIITTKRHNKKLDHHRLSSKRKRA